MKNLLVVLVALSSLNAFAQKETEKIKIKEIKNLVKTSNPDTTCLDEYLKRRKELIIKLSVSPAVAVAGTVAGGYAGGMAGIGIATATSVDGWSALGYVIVGAAAGGAAGAVATVASTTATGITLANNVLITKTVAEQQLGRSGVYSDKLYAKYLKKSQVDLSKEEFLNKLVEADQEGNLCNGSMVKQPKIKIGTKLKYKVAKLKDLVRYIDNQAL